MENKLNFRKAKLEDIDRILELICQRIDWMDKNNIDQWNNTEYLEVYPKSYFMQNIDYFFVSENNKKIVAATALYKNDYRWETSAKALYVHHLVADLKCKGAGKQLLQYSENYAKENGFNFMRLDSAVGNIKLEKFYTDQGYKEVGTCIDGNYYGILREKQL